MVGRRHGLSNTGGNIPKKYQDLESGGNKKSTKDRFRDVASQKLSDDRRNDLKKRILKGIDQGWFQEFRKSSEEVIFPCLMKKDHAHISSSKLSRTRKYGSSMKTRTKC